MGGDHRETTTSNRLARELSYFRTSSTQTRRNGLFFLEWWCARCAEHLSSGYTPEVTLNSLDLLVNLMDRTSIAQRGQTNYKQRTATYFEPDCGKSLYSVLGPFTPPKGGSDQVSRIYILPPAVHCGRNPTPRTRGEPQRQVPDFSVARPVRTKRHGAQMTMHPRVHW